VLDGASVGAQACANPGLLLPPPKPFLMSAGGGSIAVSDAFSRYLYACHVAHDLRGFLAAEPELVPHRGFRPGDSRDNEIVVTEAPLQLSSVSCSELLARHLVYIRELFGVGQ